MTNYFTDRATFTESIERTLAEYGLEVRGCHITTPGKFEGVPAWVPHFWNSALNGWQDLDLYSDEIGTISVFWYDQETHNTLGEVCAPEGWRPHTESVPGKPDVRGAIVVWEDEQGFVHGQPRVLVRRDGQWVLPVCGGSVNREEASQ